MDFMLTTRSRTDTIHSYACTLDDARVPSTWSYHVRADGSRDFYEGRFVAFGAGVVRPDMLANQGLPEYSGKGITEALFDRVVRDSGCKLISSTSQGQRNGPAEYRSVSADRVWQRLVGKRLAVYDASTDRYEYVPSLSVRDTEVPHLRDLAPTGFPDNQAVLRARVLYTLERNGIVYVVDEADNIVDELELGSATPGGWAVRFKHTR